VKISLRNTLRAGQKSLLLVSISLVEYGSPFARMIALSHGLTLEELGFASVLTASYATFEQITDIAITRFLYSASREEYDDALSAAHGLSIVRGILVAAVAMLLAPFIGDAMGLSQYNIDFALLGPPIAIRAFEHLGPKIAERDYRYGAQFKVALIANVAALGALLLSLIAFHSHVALLIALYVQMTGQTLASHVLADGPYRAQFGTVWFRKAVAFGIPLMLNGMGLAASGQGDRFIVGSLIGLPALGIYSVATLATTVPLSMISRVTGTITLAALYNAHVANDGSHRSRLNLALRLFPMLCALYAIGILTLMNIVTPLVFGAKFHLSTAALAFLACASFFRSVRGDPFTSMLLQTGRTRALAVVNFSSISALLFELLLVLSFTNFESMIAGRLLGEITAFAVAVIVTRELFRGMHADYFRSMMVAMASVGLVVALTFLTPVGVSIGYSLAALLSVGALLFGYAALTCLPLARHAFPNMFERSAAHEPYQESAPELRS